MSLIWKIVYVFNSRLFMVLSSEWMHRITGVLLSLKGDSALHG